MTAEPRPFRTVSDVSLRMTLEDAKAAGKWTLYRRCLAELDSRLKAELLKSAPTQEEPHARR